MPFFYKLLSFIFWRVLVAKKNLRKYTRKNFLNLSSKIIFFTAYYIERENYYRVISLNNHSQKII